MSSSVLTALLGWPIALVIFFGCIVLLRYIQHRERMALIVRGIDPNTLRKERRGTGFMLPQSFTAAPFHFGPWLLPGLIPLGVGSALVISYYLGQDGQPPHPGAKSGEPEVKEHTEIDLGSGTE
jgi:hypothetical protein